MLALHGLYPLCQVFFLCEPSKKKFPAVLKKFITRNLQMTIIDFALLFPDKDCSCHFDTYC